MLVKCCPGTTDKEGSNEKGRGRKGALKRKRSRKPDQFNPHALETCPWHMVPLAPKYNIPEPARLELISLHQRLHARDSSPDSPSGQTLAMSNPPVLTPPTSQGTYHSPVPSPPPPSQTPLRRTLATLAADAAARRAQGTGRVLVPDSSPLRSASSDDVPLAPIPFPMRPHQLMTENRVAMLIAHNRHQAEQETIDRLVAEGLDRQLNGINASNHPSLSPSNSSPSSSRNTVSSPVPRKRKRNPRGGQRKKHAKRAKKATSSPGSEGDS